MTNLKPQYCIWVPTQLRNTVLPPGLSDVHSQVLLLLHPCCFLHKARLAKPTSQGQKAALGISNVTQPLETTGELSAAKVSDILKVSKKDASQTLGCIYLH